MSKNYVEKEQEIINKLKETDYNFFDGDKEEALDFLEKHLAKFPKYANIVIVEQIQTPIIYARYDGQELRDKIQDMDAKRRMIHEGAISAANILNRICKALRLEIFADVDTSDRHAVAEFVGDFVNDLYNQGIRGKKGQSFDTATYGKTEMYDEGKIAEQLEKMASC